MNYKDHKDNPKSFRALTGLTHIQFCHLLPSFEAAHDDYLSEYEMNGKRRSQLRSFCIYKNSPLPDVAERLFFILVYLKNNPLQEYHAACFGMGQKHCNTFVHCLTPFPVPCTLYQDTGYQGYAPEGVQIVQPTKKAKGKELSKEEKEFNRQVSSIRVRVEHAIGSAKLMRMVKDECRLRANLFVERIFATCAALHNLRIKIKPWVYKN